MSVGRRRRLVVAAGASVLVGVLAVAAVAVEEKKFKYKIFPADIVTMATMEETDPSLVLSREINAHGGTVNLDGTFTPELSSAAVPRKLMFKTPKGARIPFLSAAEPELANTFVTSISTVLKGSIDCLEPPTDGTPPPVITAMVGKVRVVYEAINAATGRPYVTTASVRLGPGHDLAKTDDVSLSGTVISGVGEGRSFILDGVMRPAAGEDWAGCQAGTDTIAKMSFSTKSDTDGDGVSTPGYYRGGFALGYGSVSLDGWDVGGRGLDG